MYEKFFGFRLPPFGTDPDKQQLYFSETHREALARLVYGILARKPLIILTGDVGLGKTTMLRAAIARVTTHQALRVVALPHPLLRPGDVLRCIGRELEMPNAQQIRVSDLDLVHEAIKKLVIQGQRLALVIDEAQSLPAETLEFVRLMSNLDAGLSGNFQIVLVGQPELWQKLQGFEFRHLRQRIAIRAELHRLTNTEAADYLSHRLKQSGASIEQIFTRAALKALIREGHGAPRRLNCIADNALLLAFGDQRKPVDVDDVLRAAETQDRVDDGMLGWRRWFRKPLIWATVPALAAFVFVVVSVILFGPAQITKAKIARHDRGVPVPHVEASPVPTSSSAEPAESALPAPETPAGQNRMSGTAVPESDSADRMQTETAAAATLSTSDPVGGPQAAATTSRPRTSQ